MVLQFWTYLQTANYNCVNNIISSLVWYMCFRLELSTIMLRNTNKSISFHPKKCNGYPGQNPTSFNTYNKLVPPPRLNYIKKRQCQVNSSGDYRMAYMVFFKACSNLAFYFCSKPYHMLISPDGSVTIRTWLPQKVLLPLPIF